MAKSDDTMKRLRERAIELEDDSLDWGHAYARAWLEHLINDLWPPEWGDDLHVIIYGDFRPPESKIYDERLGLTVYPEKLEDTVIHTALCALKTTVSLKDRNIESIMDAIRRLNLFLGAWTLTSWGNNQIGWWCHLTHGSEGSASVEVKIDDILSVTGKLCDLPVAVRLKVDSALYWMRATPALLRGTNDMHVFRAFSAHWNAFECLVEAIHICQPEPHLSKAKKQKAIDDYTKQCGERLTARHIDELYRTVVNPGFVGRAKHALRVCFKEVANVYIHECFDRPDGYNRFYEIRNAINHGDIDAENPEERMRIESRLSWLHLMLLQLFACIVPYSFPAVEGFTRRVSRKDEGTSV